MFRQFPVKRYSINNVTRCIKCNKVLEITELQKDLTKSKLKLIKNLTNAEIDSIEEIKGFYKKHIEYINDEIPLNIEEYIKYNNIKQTKRRPANLFWLIIAIIGGLIAFLKLNIKKNLNEKSKQ